MPELSRQRRQEYKLNLIDTPGHVDFTYEVSRSLAACEGALLVVDAAQGVEAQTVANVHMAFDHNLEILPVINKIDLPSADAERVRAEIEEVIGIDASHAIPASAKEGIGTEDILEGIVTVLSAAQGRSRRAVAGADYRLLVRSLPWRGGHDAGVRRHDEKGHEDSHDGERECL